MIHPVDVTFWLIAFVYFVLRSLHVRRLVSAWATRNSNRIFTLWQLALAVDRFRSGHFGWGVVYVALFLVSTPLWNLPRDDDDDRKRRRKKVAEKKSAPNWSGMEPAR